LFVAIIPSFVLSRGMWSLSHYSGLCVPSSVLVCVCVCVCVCVRLLSVVREGVFEQSRRLIGLRPSFVNSFVRRALSGVFVKC